MYETDAYNKKKEEYITEIRQMLEEIQPVLNLSGIRYELSPYVEEVDFYWVQEAWIWLTEALYPEAKKALAYRKQQSEVAWNRMATFGLRGREFRKWDEFKMLMRAIGRDGERPRFFKNAFQRKLTARKEKENEKAAKAAAQAEQSDYSSDQPDFINDPVESE